MKLYELFGKRGFHTSIVTSFGIDFGAYENVMLARLRGAGCYNNLLTVDSGMLSLALEGGSELPRHAGRTYTVTPASRLGVFHPKIVLQLGRSSARLIVSSANVTAAGLAGNLEVAGVIEAEDANTGEARLVAAGWNFLSTFLDQKLEGVRRQIEWMLARTPWLRHTEPAEGVVKLLDGSNAAFFGTDATAGIAERFLSCFEGDKVHRLIVISPYWDENLASLNLLLERIAPSECYLLLDHGRHVFQPKRIAREQQPRVKLIDFKSKDKSRFIHAKIIVAQTDRRDHVLYGSANCTQAALGGEGFGGSNAEACLYRALPAGAAVEALELGNALKVEPLLHHEFQSPSPPPDIPLEEVTARFPGHFTSMFETLIWSPPPGADPAKDRIELLDQDGTPIASDLRRIDDSGDGAIRFQLRGKERPAFARVRRHNGSLSAPAIIVVLDELRDAVRDARNRRIDAALAQLDGETDLGLWLLETLNELEAAEAALAGGERTPFRRAGMKDHSTSQAPPPEHYLTYEQFMAGRRLRSEVEGLNRNSLSGSHLSHIRGFLNRLLQVGGSTSSHGEEEAIAQKNAFNLGDETPDAEGAIESGIEFNKRPLPSESPGVSANKLAAEHVAKRRRANREQLIAAVADLGDAVVEKAKSEGLRCLDLLRLRAMLMILATAAWDGATPPKNSLQVLPPAGDSEAAWPRLLGKVLFIYFGGRKIAIQTLVLDGFYDQIPDDILECWASCMWAIQVALLTAARHREHRALSRGLESLRDSIYRVVALRQEEMGDARILGVLDALNKRFASSLCLDCDAIYTAHWQAVKNVLKKGGSLKQAL
jgi:hypothetical protein